MVKLPHDESTIVTDSDTIVAQATPAGRGGVAIVRVSGPMALTIAERITGLKPTPRYAHYGPFYTTGQQHQKQLIDQGITLFFKAPHSFTGEDVLELQGHGGQIISDLIIQQVIACGARMARPGEFSERAFLNNKLDLAQAEAIADLIDSNSEQAAMSALRTLQGEFSKRIHRLVEALVELRIHVEAAIDFPEEEIDFLNDGKINQRLQQLIDKVREVLALAAQGAILREGITVVMAGLPNAGKSSLMNQLSGRESAIVTDIPGTTRDLLHEHIQVDGLPLHIIDTAGLRESNDPIEQEGIRRAWQQIKQADRILLIVDSDKTQELHPYRIWPDFIDHLDSLDRVSLVQNKVDISGLPAEINRPNKQAPCPVIGISAKTGAGIDQLKQHLKECVGYQSSMEGSFSARRRHLDALQRALSNLLQGQEQLNRANAGELLAEDLRSAQQSLSEITGEFTSDDLLGRIFSSFCIGK